MHSFHVASITLLGDYAIHFFPLLSAAAATRSPVAVNGWSKSIMPYVPRVELEENTF